VVAAAVTQGEETMRNISINITPEDLTAIDQVATDVPLATRHAVARAAFRLGLSQMVEDHELALDRLVAEATRRSVEGGAA